MKLLTGKISDIRLPHHSSLAIGMFDGIHLGHKKVLMKCIEKAQFYNLTTAVLTFLPHPKNIVEPEKKFGRIYSQEYKNKLLEEFKLDYLIIAECNIDLLEITADYFVTNILLGQLKCKSLTTGENFRFGKNRKGDSNLLRRLSKEKDFIYNVVAVMRKNNSIISSTAIKYALQLGMMRQVNSFLGRNYILAGIVLRGRKIGRKFGFHTANLMLPTDLSLPLYGVYYVWVTVYVNGCLEKINAIANIGLRPTVDTNLQPILEVHILNFAEDIYDQNIAVEFICFIRPERKFQSIQALQVQIKRDIANVRFLISQEKDFTADVVNNFSRI
tara:strand:+ start:539 stop:1525 length:987 start_codon:yes stop_codon:yes gene_type:complete